MNFLITGGTRFIGKQLTKTLIEKGHHVYIMTRNPEANESSQHTTFVSYQVQADELPPIYGVVNLAGESLFGRWTIQKKENIRNSRLEVTEKVIELMRAMVEKPKVFVSGSAVGYYGTSKEKIFTEETDTPGNDFLSSVVVDWEDMARRAERLGIRTVYARFGIVLGKNGGSFPLMALPVKGFVGGKIGDGEQWISWIHMMDAANLLEFCIFDDSIKGTVNVTAPDPKRNKDFYRTLATVYRRPYWSSTPGLFLRIILGEMATLVLDGQYAYPKKAMEQGFIFQYPKLEKALESLI